MSKELAIFGGNPVRKKSFPAWPRISNEIKESLINTYENEDWGGEKNPSIEGVLFGRHAPTICGSDFKEPIGHPELYSVIWWFSLPKYSC